MRGVICERDMEVVARRRSVVRGVIGWLLVGYCGVDEAEYFFSTVSCFC